MKSILSVLFLLLALNGLSQGPQLEAFFTYSTFESPSSGPYMEAYLSFNASTLKYKKIGENQYQGSVEVTYVFYQGDSINSFKKFNILSPVIQDTLHGLVDLIDYQRLPLNNGDYTFEISLKDLNRNSRPFSGRQDISIQYYTDTTQISDITFLKSYKKAEGNEFSKSGISFVPYMTDFFPEVQTRLIYYTELYYTDKILGKDQPFLVKTYLKDYNTDRILNNWTKYRKYTANVVTVVLDEFNIEKLPSGNYQFVIEAISKENVLLDQKTVFLQRSNPKMELSAAELSITNDFVEEMNRITHRDTLLEYIKCLSPIADMNEKKFIEENYKTTDLDNIRTFFINFWTTRYPTTAGVEWVKYKQRIDFTNTHYSTLLKPGYQTDRGEIYLKYGLPNQITDRQNEPSSYPYIIWHYYDHPRKANAKYVFYNPDLVTNDYELLHSTVPGELNNYRWQFILQKRNTNNNSVDRTSGDEHWGGRAEDYFNNPR